MKFDLEREPPDIFRWLAARAIVASRSGGVANMFACYLVTAALMLTIGACASARLAGHRLENHVMGTIRPVRPYGNRNLFTFAHRWDGAMKDIIRSLQAQGWEKRFAPSDAGINVAPYNPPLLISVTSSEDQATNWIWRAGHFLQKPSTDGHDPQLATHNFGKSSAIADCPAADYPDFNQPWHCLHKDANLGSLTPRFRLDLPDHDRSSGAPLTHTAHDLIPKDTDTPALIQMSGVLASAAGDGWAANFSEVWLD